MKIKASVLVASVAVLMMSAGSKETRSTEGINPGDLAPRIKFLENSNQFNFQNQPEQCTLLNFWAAYDAESRARNVRMSNEVARSYAGEIAVVSVSLDQNQSIFEETVRIDKLEWATQLQEPMGSASEIYRKYKLNRGFSNFLIDNKGVIIARDVNPEKLAEMMKLN